jgi:hypothetical protein
MSPQRIQLRRTNGWRKPEGAVSVGRPGKWGNPYRVRRCDNDSDNWSVIEPDGTAAGIEVDYADTKANAMEIAVDYFRHERHNTPYPSLDEICAELAGHDLACWYPLIGADGNRVPCHADVLLEVANSSSFPKEDRP